MTGWQGGKKFEERGRVGAGLCDRRTKVMWEGGTEQATGRREFRTGPWGCQHLRYE